jgi:hypothetical protein
MIQSRDPEAHVRRAALPKLILGVCLVAGCQPERTGEGAHTTSQDDLGRTPAGLVSLWVDMWNSYDLDQVPELFLTDDRVTYFSSEFEGVIHGFHAVVEHHRGFGFVPGGVARGTRLWVEELTEGVFGGAAVLTAIWYFQREEPAVGGGAAEGGTTAAPPPQRGPVTFVCILDHGRWRFAHMSFGNYPLDESPGEARPG